jgi:hypothetical protein
MQWPRMCKDLHTYYPNASTTWYLRKGEILHIKKQSPTYYLYASQRLMTNSYQTIPTTDVCMTVMWETDDKRN